MQTLIIYDNDGYILSVQQGNPSPREPIGVPFLWVEIPSGKQLKGGVGVDVSSEPHTAILEDIPKSEVEILNERIQSTQQAVDFLLLNGGL